MVYKKTYVSKVLTLLLCAVVALSAFWRGGFKSSAASVLMGQVKGSFTVTQQVHYPAALYNESTKMYSGAFNDWVLSYPVSIAFNDITIPRGHRALVSVDIYGKPTVSSAVGGHPLCNSVVYHMTKSGVEHSEVVKASHSTTTFYIDYWDDKYFTVQLESYISDTFISNKYYYGLINYSGTFNYTITVYDVGVVSTATSDSQGHSDAQDQLDATQKQTDALKDQTKQQAEDAAKQLEEQQKQTDALKDQTKQQAEDAAKQLEEQQKQTAIQEEQKETTKGIFGKITSFFDGFGDMVKGFFVPSSDELMTFLDEVNTWFGDRLGFIYYPFDLAVTLVKAYAMGDANQQFTVPALTLNLLGEQYTIWQSFTVDLDAMGIFTYVRYFTSAILCLGVGKLAVSKWDDWIGGKRG